MLRKSKELEKNIIIAFFMFVIITTQIVFLVDNTGYFTIFLPAGVAAGFYISFGKKVLPGIIISTILGVFLSGLLFTDRNATEAVLFVLPMFFMIIVSSLLLDYLLKLFNSVIPNTITKGVYFLIAISITILLVSILPALQFSTTSNIGFLDEYILIIGANVVGMSVFATTIILSNHYDKFFTWRNLPRHQDFIFAIIFNIATFLIFSRTFDGIGFASYGPVFIILFMINAFMFDYRMLIFISYIYISIYNVVYFRILDISNEGLTSTVANSYLFILVVITIFTKILVHEINLKNKELTITKDRFEGMLDSTISLLKVRDTLSYDDDNYQEKYMRNIFNISMRIFDEIEFGTCVLEGEKEIQILETKGYDLEYFKTLHLDVKKFRWDYYEPVLQNNPNEVYKNALGERYSLFVKDFPKIKQSVSILIKLSETEHGAITFDIPQNSTKEFTKSNLNNISAFQRMINSYYEMNELAIKNNNLKDDIVLSLIRTLELYDQYTGGHSEDVATISLFLAEKLNLSESAKYDVYWAGIVHDIGKIGISSDIINKQGRLTLEEYEQVKQHPIFGFDILNRSSDLKTIAKLVKHHHEWYNGSGYPNGLKQDAIPFGSQILQVADSVSSMATKRSYQDAKSFDKIKEELELYKGTQFSPIIADKMIELIDEKIIINYFGEKDK